MNATHPWPGISPTAYYAVTAGLIVIALFLAVRPLLRPPVEQPRRHDWWWGLLILTILLAGRWPSLLFPRELDGDESQMFAGAAALVHDPVFWRAVDGHTAGPLNFFALWPAGALIGWNDYLAPRLTAFVLIGLSLILAHQSLSLVFGRTTARLAGLGTLCWESLTNAIGLLHYSTELVSLTLLTTVIYLAVRRWLQAGSVLFNFIGGVLLGAVPFAKLQAAPIAFCLGLAWLLAEISRQAPDRPRRVAYLGAGAVLPLAVFLLQLGLAGEFHNAYVPYLLNNILYTRYGLQAPVIGSIWERFARISIEHDSLSHLWLPATIVSVLLMLRWRDYRDRTHRLFLAAAGLLFALSALSVFIPGRPFLHYFQLLSIPATLLLGAVLGPWLANTTPATARRRQGMAIFCAVLILAPMLVQRAAAPSELLGMHVSLYQYRRSTLSQRILPHVRPGDSVVIWGWSCFVNVETGLWQATRDAHIQFLVMPGPYQDYYRQRFLEDFVNTLPEFFLDSIGRHSPMFHDPALRHDENFPVLAAVIRSHYELVEDFEGARLYQRKQRKEP